MKKVFFFAVVLCLAYLQPHAQVNEQVLENISEQEGVGGEAQQLLEAAEDFDNNLNKNINTLSQEDMILLGLSNFQILCLQEYLRRSGDMLSLNELYFVNGMDSMTIERIKPYLYAKQVVKLPALKIDSIFKYAKQSLRIQYSQGLQQPYGYTRTDGKGFKGENFSSSLRYNFKYYDRLEFSLVADKDAGEPLYYKHKTYGYDHYNISLTIKDVNKYLKQLTIGDYRLAFASGLAMCQQFSLGYFNSYYGSKNIQNRITAFRSTSEYNYNKGFASWFTIKNFDIYAFASYTPLDYNGKSIQQTGYHRTSLELTHKDSTQVIMYGSSLQYTTKGLSLGTTFFIYNFGDSLRIGNQAYMQRNFQGKRNNILSFNASYNYRNMLLFFETAKDKDNHLAALFGLQVDFAYKTNLSIIYRDYSSKYHNFYADAIGYHANNQNERGLYVDYSKYFSKHLSFYIGADICYFPFMVYRAYKPSWMQKFKTQLNLKPNEKHSFDIYLRANNHQYNYYTTNTDTTLANNLIYQMQIRYKYAINNYLSAVYRIGYSHSWTKQESNNYGFFNYLELVARSPYIPIEMNMRYTYFHCTDYDNRFYVYEYSLPLSYSSSMLYNTGNKLYIILNYHITTQLHLHLKYSYTRFSNTKSISSGNSLINSNYQQYLSAQLFYKF